MSDYDPQNDYYLILGLDSPTSSQLVQSAFLQKKAILGPPTPGNASLREQLDLAFHHLSDVVRRRRGRREPAFGPAAQAEGRGRDHRLRSGGPLRRGGQALHVLPERPADPDRAEKSREALEEIGG